MDDLQIGIRLRAARIRRGWRQCDIAARAGVSDATVSRIERGQLDTVSLRTLRRVAAVLEVRLDLTARARSGDLDRLVNARHAALAEAVIAWLLTIPGWEVRPEVSFSVYGERGVIDILAWHAVSRSLLVIELKTEIVDVGEVLGTFDRKRRLAIDAARSLGWRPASVSTWLIVGEGRTNRRRVDAHRAVFRAALPASGRTIAAWLRHPAGERHALSMWPNRHPGSVRSAHGTTRRVHRAKGSTSVRD